MRLKRPAFPVSSRPSDVRNRILGSRLGGRDEALIFAASSVINEVAAPQYDGSPVVRAVVTERGRYQLEGSRVYINDTEQPVVFVYAEAAPTAELTGETLRERFGLTRKESRVAELLATHKSNRDIARELFISSHTARHHTQNVLGKLGVSSRREVAGVLRGLRAP
ncbi:MAG TPA: helix-turn-helix transcriptional regulator [Longimicrobiales bacterium]